ncbi:hypothetical protein AUJ46_04520 [Candidatus Peregrinibacteria bacterium CG1_02_54_53]|nr:MAG: hypothetical protein AUJ46_04520 [Candidatus Peregrinibacteria bacterium CG1_02_54_53]
MRRTILFLLAVAVLGGIPLFLYLREAPSSVPSAEVEKVMNLAAQKSRSLQSARLTGEGHFRITNGAIPASGTVELSGVLQDAGESLQISISIDSLLSPAENRSQTFRLRGKGEMVVLGKKDLYFNIQSLATEPDDSLFQPELVALLAGQWWSVPSASPDEGTVPGGTMTPTPNLLRAQSQVVRVVRDRGTTSMDGATVFHYDVAIDQDKLLAYLEQVAAARNETLDREQLAGSLMSLQATGEMWIDAETYVLRQATWTIEDLRMQQSAVDISFSIHLSDFDTAPTIAPPADAKLFAPASFFGIEAKQNVPGGSLSPQQIEEYRSLLEEAPALTE